MNIKLLLSILFCLLVTGSYSQGTFQRSIYYLQGTEADVVQQTSDGGYIISGTAYDESANANSLYLIKTNSSGDTLWTKIYHRDFSYECTSMQQTTDGGYIVAGKIDQPDSTNGFILKTDASGKFLWAKQFTGGINSIQQTIDGGYIFSGNNNSSDGSDLGIYLVKTNNKGIVSWSQTYGGQGLDLGLSVKQTADSGYVICGATLSFKTNTTAVYLIKTNATGDTLWTRVYYGNEASTGNSVQQTMDGGYIISGDTYSFGAGQGDIFLIKTTSSGDTVWTKMFRANQGMNETSMQQTSDSGYIITGFSYGFGAGSTDIYLIKTNSKGDTLWTKAYGGTGLEYAYSISQTGDRGYIIGGSTKSFVTQKNGGMYLIRTDAEGNSDCHVSGTTISNRYAPMQIAGTNTKTSSGITTYPLTFTTKSGGQDSIICASITLGINEPTYFNNTLSVYPNPANNKLTVVNGTAGIKTMVIYNIFGETVEKESGEMNKELFIDINSFLPGVYFIKVVDEKGMQFQKFIKE